MVSVTVAGDLFGTVLTDEVLYIALKFLRHIINIIVRRSSKVLSKESEVNDG